MASFGVYLSFSCYDSLCHARLQCVTNTTLHLFAHNRNVCGTTVTYSAPFRGQEFERDNLVTCRSYRPLSNGPRQMPIHLLQVPNGRYQHFVPRQFPRTRKHLGRFVPLMPIEGDTGTHATAVGRNDPDVFLEGDGNVTCSQVSPPLSILT